MMKEEDKGKAQESDHLQEYAEWKKRYEDEAQDPRETFKQISNIAVLMSYDLIDKLRFWEKATLDLPDEEILKRLPHTAAFLEKLRTAYLDFADVDL